MCRWRPLVQCLSLWLCALPCKASKTTRQTIESHGGSQKQLLELSQLVNWNPSPNPMLASPSPIPHPIPGPAPAPEPSPKPDHTTPSPSSADKLKIDRYVIVLAFGLCALPLLWVLYKAWFGSVRVVVVASPGKPTADGQDLPASTCLLQTSGRFGRSQELQDVCNIDLNAVPESWAAVHVAPIRGAVQQVLVATIEHRLPLKTLFPGSDLRLRPGFEADEEGAATQREVKVVAGGLGKVAGELQAIHPTDYISVHPCMDALTTDETGARVVKKVFQNQGPHDYCFQDWEQQDPIVVTVDGAQETIEVYRVIQEPEEANVPKITFMMLQHREFNERQHIYPKCASSIESLRFFSLWNQAVGKLIAHYKPEVFMCPDYHPAIAPWYAWRELGSPTPVAVILHNAEYQGAITSEQLGSKSLRRLAEIFDLPSAVIQRHMVTDGCFNQLQAVVSYVKLTQNGRGFSAVSHTYAEESKQRHSLLWPLQKIAGLPNPMIEHSKVKDLIAEGKPPLWFQKQQAKTAVQRALDLKVSENARLVVFLGRLAKQKGVDYIADTAEWLLSSFDNLQLVVIGPIDDAFGEYANASMTRISKQQRFVGRIHFRGEFVDLKDKAYDLKLACDFCLMPSRDEPFGYVDIEFAWKGALTIGSFTGGLGKVPGVYYVSDNVESIEAVCKGIKSAASVAMSLPDKHLRALSYEALYFSFPVGVWQQRLMDIYGVVKDASSNSAAWIYPSGSQVERLPPRVQNSAQFLKQELDQQKLQEDVQRKVQVQEGSEFVKPSSCPETLMQVGWAVLLDQETSRCTRWLGQQALGMTRIDVVLCLAYILGPLLAAWCLAPVQGDIDQGIVKGLAPGLQGQDFPAYVLCATDVVQAVSMVIFALLSMKVRPHHLMASITFVKILLIPLPILYRYQGLWPPAPPTQTSSITTSTTTIPLTDLDMTKIYFIVAKLSLGVVGGADMIFIAYNFMSSAIGDISKVAIRMGCLYGIMQIIGQISVGFGKWMTHISAPYWILASCGGSLSLIFLVMGLFILQAPAPYREYRLPEWNFIFFMRRRKTLRYLGAAQVLGAAAMQGKDSATFKMFNTFIPEAQFPWLFSVTTMPYFMLVATIGYAVILYKLPSEANSLVKGGAFLLMPMAVVQGCILWYAEVNLTQNGPVDPVEAHSYRIVLAFFLISLGLETVRCVSITVAILVTVGGRWRYIIFATMFNACGLLASSVLRFAQINLGNRLPIFTILLVCGLLEWVVQVWGCFYFDSETAAALTRNKKDSAFHFMSQYTMLIPKLIQKMSANAASQSTGSPEESHRQALISYLQKVDMDPHTGVRGVCCVWVVVYHLLAGRFKELTYIKGEGASATVRPIVIDIQGCTLMPVFYLITGFALAVSSECTKIYRMRNTYGDAGGTDNFDHLQFYKKRIARVLPGYYLTFLLALPLVFLGFGPFAPEDTATVAASIASNILLVPTLLNTQLPPWPSVFMFPYDACDNITSHTHAQALNSTQGCVPVDSNYCGDSSFSNTEQICCCLSWPGCGKQFNGHSPTSLKLINGPSWTVTTLFWFYISFPFVLHRVQRWEDMMLLRVIGISYWVQQILVHVIFWSMMSMSLDLDISNLSGLSHWHLEPGNVAFTAATQNPISRFPVFIMGVCAGVYVSRHVKKPSLPWPGSLYLLLPSWTQKGLPDLDQQFSLPNDEQTWGRYGPLWWSRMVDRTTGMLMVAFLVEIIADGIVLNWVQRDSDHPQGLCGAVWFQAVIAYAYLTILVGLTRENPQIPEKLSRTRRFLMHRITQWFGMVSFCIYLIHFPLLEYVTWAVGTEAIPGVPHQQTRKPFGLAGHNWGADSRLPWYVCIAVFVGAIVLGRVLYSFEDFAKKKLVG